MHGIGQSSVPTEEALVETFASLRLAEPSEKVHITLDERMLSIQGRRHATIDIRLNAIHTMKHHSTNLVPTWMIFLALALIWIGYRVMVPPMYRFEFIAVGALILTARVLTKKPTLTLQTNSGDTHVLFGNERMLHRLSFMFHHLEKGKSMEHVRRLLEVIGREGALDPGSEIEGAPMDVPVIIHRPRSIDKFLAEDKDDALSNDAMNSENSTPEWAPTDEKEHALESTFTTFIPGFFAQQNLAEAHRYPVDHRPMPVYSPHLVPATTPPLHQGSFSNSPTGFLPSFMSHDQAHVPGMQPRQHDEAQTEEFVLDAEIPEEVEETQQTLPSPHLGQRPSESEQLLKPKQPKSKHDSPFTPRRSRSLQTRSPARASQIFSGVFERSRNFIQRIQRPPAYARSETTAALRDRAEEHRDAAPQSSVMASLSTENGGVIDMANAARLEQRSQSILATAEAIREHQVEQLDTLSFQDLQPSKSPDEDIVIPRLDEE